MSSPVELQVIKLHPLRVGLQVLVLVCLLRQIRANSMPYGPAGGARAVEPHHVSVRHDSDRQTETLPPPFTHGVSQ